MLFKTNKKIFFCIRKTWTQSWLKLCSSVFVIDSEQVNAPREAFNVITIRHLNAQSQQQKHYEKVWNMSRVKLFREKCLGEGFHGGQFSEGGYCPEGNYLGVVRGYLSSGELFRGNCPGGNCFWGNFVEGSCPGGNFIKWGGQLSKGRNIRTPFCSTIIVVKHPFWILLLYCFLGISSNINSISP